MKRVLSIDWDYFVDASMELRTSIFPDGGNENLSEFIKESIWNFRYTDSEELKSVKVSPDFRTFLKICRTFDPLNLAVIADSHKWIYHVIDSHVNPDEELEVYNVDFHHDFYNYMTFGERVNCGNWGTILREERPNTKFFWIGHSDSDDETIGGVPVDIPRMTLKELDKKFKGDYSQFDILYVCRSGMWSPPHLDKNFCKGARIIENRSLFLNKEPGITEPRSYRRYDFPHGY